jgi:hypothetical protein
MPSGILAAYSSRLPGLAKPGGYIKTLLEPPQPFFFLFHIKPPPSSPSNHHHFRYRLQYHLFKMDPRFENYNQLYQRNRLLRDAVVEPGSRKIRSAKSIIKRKGLDPLAACDPATADHDVAKAAIPGSVPTASAFNFSMKWDVPGKSGHVANHAAEAPAVDAVPSSVFEPGFAPADLDSSRNRPLLAVPHEGRTEQEILEHHRKTMLRVPDLLTETSGDDVEDADKSKSDDDDCHSSANAVKSVTASTETCLPEQVDR